MTSARSCLRAIALIIAVAGCDPVSSEAPPTPDRASYAVWISGDRDAALAGISVTQVFPEGYSEPDAPGTLLSTRVILILLASTDLSKPQVNLGLMGPLEVGTYTVRTVSADKLGTRREFYGAFITPATDGGSQRYSASTGTVTLTSVSPCIEGSFTFHASWSITTPATPTPGATYRSVPASLDATGTFCTRAP